VKTVFEDDLIKYLPLRDKDGRRILYVHCGSKCSDFFVGLNN